MLSIHVGYGNLTVNPTLEEGKIVVIRKNQLTDACSTKQLFQKITSLNRTYFLLQEYKGNADDSLCVHSITGPSCKGQLLWDYGMNLVK